MRTFPLTSILLATLTLGIAACGGGSASATGDGTTPAAAQYEGPLTSTDVASGETHYNQYCAGCHPGGEAGAGPLINNIAWTPAKMREQIREGEGTMPPVPESKLDAAGLEALLAYLQTMGAVGG